MEKKSLGRALEDISHLFLSSSPADTNREITDTGFWSVGIRDETCASCVHHLEDRETGLKCRIFSLENEKFGVPHIENITYGHARYCKHYTPSRKGTPDESLTEAPSPGNTSKGEEGPDLEEKISITRKMAYPDSESGQQRMKAAILNYLREGYEVRRVELRKHHQVIEPGRKETRDEVLSVVIRDDATP
jgi:hypothetical protein